ncbi:hypothetical protein ABO03_005008 [Salmonella enterica subsp. enterica serovar Glostrup]|nr:hypothetical protein [Salmonella enterica subsp. enterica]EBP9900680.1 hypothetical protein [Salmonella enterica]ECE0473705.1 hypothetical protein [Salmonella enterica subsp. enterica serovar Glostrup]EHA9228974.1 hypothetical protein [Salmonella enterica subsp. enterica serovar Glostrup]
MCSVGEITPRSGGGMICQAAENPWQADACGAALPAIHGMRTVFAVWCLLFCRPGAHGHLRLPAA